MNLDGRDAKGRFTSRMMSGKNNPNWVGGKIVIPCSTCGKELLRLPCRLRRGKNFCDVSCKAEWQKGKKMGPDSPHWKGGRIIVKGGYVQVHVPVHPRARHSGYVYEHILVAEKKYGEEITSDWHVHHLNGIKADNRPENLVKIRPKDHDRHTIVHRLQERIVELEKQLSEKS